MIIDPNLARLFQAQYNAELQNELVYRQLSEIMDAQSWHGFHRFFHAAAKDEHSHANAFADFLVDRGETPVVDAHPAPGIMSTLPGELLASALLLERANTEKLKALEAACADADDQEARHFVHKYLKEQRQSERDLTNWSTLAQRANGNYAAMLIVDKKIKP